MTEPTEPIAFVRYYNAWRVGGDMDQPEPSTITRMLTELCDYTERLERELEQERQDRKQADLDTIRALGERNDERKLADRLAGALSVYWGDCRHLGYYMPEPANRKAEDAVAAWKEARNAQD